MNGWHYTSAIVSLVLSQAAFAATNFDIAPKGTLPTSVAPGQTVSAFYTVTNKTGTTRNGYSVVGLPSTVSQNPATGRCSSPINLGAFASCILQLDITGAVNSKFALCKGSSCTTSSAPLVVTQGTAPPVNNIAKYAYFTQTGSTYGVQICPINANGGLGSCSDANGGLSSKGIAPAGIAISADNSHAYLNDTTGSNVYSCTISPTDGTFSSTCTRTIIAAPANYLANYYGLIAVNHSNTWAYVVGQVSPGAPYYGVIACPINNGVISSGCTTALSGLQDYPAGVSLNATDNTIYVGFYDDNTEAGIKVCSVNGASISGCVNITGGGAISFGTYPIQAQVNPAGTIVYVSDENNYKIYACTPEYTISSGSTGTFNDCIDTGYAGLNGAASFAINKVGTEIYVTTYGSTVYSCPIKGTTYQNVTIGLCQPYTMPSNTNNVALGYPK